MRVGIGLANYSSPHGSPTFGAALAHLARRAEEAGFDSLWVWDQLYWAGSPVGPGVTDKDMVEAYTTLAFLAAATRTVKLGTMVTGVTYRHPAVLVKQVTTLDVLSGGRTYLGIGAAWFAEEHRGLGIPFPPTAERFEQLEETVQIALQMWADEGAYDRATPYHGQHFALERTLNVPQALQRPHPPILIGGNGEHKTLRLVAQYGDACNLIGQMHPAWLTRKLAALRDHCARLGRPYGAIEKTFMYGEGLRLSRTGGAETMAPGQVIDDFKTLAGLGFDTCIVYDDTLTVTHPEVLDLWATEVLPVVNTLPVAGR